MKKEVKKSKAIDGKELIIAMDELEKEKGIKKDVLIESIETALITAYKRNYDSNSDNVKVIMDKETGETHLYIEKDVVENVEDEKLQISLEDAHKVSKKLEIGDKAQIEVIPKNFGRIAAQTAKQVIIQKIREVSREVLFNEFSEKKGEIVSGIIQKADGGVVILDLGKLEGVIEIKSISRDAGSRSKIAVYSPNENIDPVGSCVGQKGIRIQNIINELNGEKIDVIEWNQDPAIYISAALLPAKVLAVDIKEDEKFAQVIVPDDQLSLAIGKAGQNARLAAKLTNWKIDIKSESQFRKLIEEMKENDVADENAKENEE